MLVFVTHPKYFDKKVLYRKNVDLIYIFNSKKLFDELSKKYRCVNIGIDGTIKNENFFPKAKKYKKITKIKFLEVKIGIYSYFKKKQHSFFKKYYSMMRGYKDTEYHLLINHAKKQKEFNDSIMMLDTGIMRCIVEIIKLEKGERFLEKNIELLRVLQNYSHTFYRSYVYSLGFERGFEIFGDIFRYNYFNKVVLYYLFNKYDVYKKGFHYNYLKVLSRLFIEDIHKNNIKGFVEKNIEYYKENEWL